ncbi:MAG: hypothetical protein O7C59_00900 [Rickettsia endosymbiont of Ixodes persulcatus]|nr:hypothetical protein [Rickettsia endosymbiont of Ixodes persulcatus]MCZ6903100.1 hypothetical protein [Rickettsia endosymbiont of Ixodes persulcatus]MCZ6910050.1 hypothetical protein [Rickettsia endosymbiont of Ixodes persulcatus]MCZ6913208.1 hypothetical protein [Rickettsia endosymbiont of Ixodes persulcatus]MCZ6919410.1 hypothetical protein [Rickettsia endosymbiont of Ixodes persulcatus]
MSTKKEKSDNVKYEEQNLSMITKELKSQTKDLEKQIKAMQENNLILWKLPDNLSDALKATTPDIASELQKRIFQSNLDKIQKANEAIDDMMQQFDKKITTSLIEADRQISQSLSKVKRLTNNMIEYETGSFKRKLIIGATAFVMLVASCCISSYIIYKKFPGRVEMRHDGPMLLKIVM